jgi:hypothetical protein
LPRKVPIRIVIVRHRLEQGFLEDLLPVDLFLNRATRNQPVDDHVLGLPKSERPIDSLHRDALPWKLS